MPVVPDDTRKRLKYHFHSGKRLKRIVANHQRHLSKHRPASGVHFRRQLASRPEAARAEALVAWFVRKQGYTPVCAHGAKGGPDFSCTKGDDCFFLEVTSLGADAVDKHAHFNRKLETMQQVAPITRLIHRSVIAKTRQVGNKNAPRVVAIVTDHTLGQIFLDGDFAETLLTSDLVSALSLHGRDTHRISGLSDCVFFRYDRQGALQLCRRSISALLLIHYSEVRVFRS